MSSYFSIQVSTESIGEMLLNRRRTKSRYAQFGSYFREMALVYPRQHKYGRCDTFLIISPVLKNTI